MKTKRPVIPKRLQNQVSDQCGYACANPKCRNLRSSRHEFHHIDENPANNVLENLILLCSGCHSDHHQGTVSTSDIFLWKRMAEFGYLPAPTTPKSSAQSLVHENHGIVGQNVRIEKITVKATSRKSGSANTLPGTIGADPDMRDYANYLVKKYIEWRKMGITKGIDRRKFSPSSASSILSEGFGSQTVLIIPAHQFSAWVAQAHAKIDNTIWGRNNIHRNYHTWEEHLEMRHGKRKNDNQR